jgi:hypothetical protein
MTSLWADPLHEGPVPGELTDEQLIDVRARHLASGEDGLDVRDVVAGLRRWRERIDDHAAYDELVLWFEHDLFDQLNLVQVLSRIAQTVRGSRPVSLICIGSFPGHPQFKGLGELSPAEIGPLLETRQPATDAHYDLATRAWAAFRASNPHGLAAVVGSDTSALPFLSAALQRHLEEFPWTRDGLSRTERRLLQLAHDAPIEIGSAFRRVHDDETAFFMGDSSFWGVVEELESARPPLVSVSKTSSQRRRLPPGTISLTDDGRGVLGGRADRVELCGLDRWLGGVHLESPHAIWRWDDARARIGNAEC